MIVNIRDVRCAIIDNMLSWKGRRASFQLNEKFAVDDKQYEIINISKSEFQENVFNATLKELT